MYINIPNAERYYNQHWVVGLRVATDSGVQSSFSLALYPRYWIKTEAKPKIRGKGMCLINSLRSLYFCGKIKKRGLRNEP